MDHWLLFSNLTRLSSLHVSALPFNSLWNGISTSVRFQSYSISLEPIISPTDSSNSSDNPSTKRDTEVAHLPQWLTACFTRKELLLMTLFNPTQWAKTSTNYKQPKSSPYTTSRSVQKCSGTSFLQSLKTVRQRTANFCKRGTVSIPWINMLQKKNCWMTICLEETCQPGRGSNCTLNQDCIPSILCQITKKLLPPFLSTKMWLSYLLLKRQLRWCCHQTDREAKIKL